LTDLGRRLFSDHGLSAKGDRACQSCHDPAFAFGPPPSLDSKASFRAAPSLRYLQTVPRFTLHRIEDDGIDQGPAGGLMWDGRAGSVHEQARLPLLSEDEMGNRTDAALAARIRALPLADEIRRLFGEAVLSTDAAAINAVLLSLEVYEQNPPDFAPFDSKYDALLRGETKLTPREEHGRTLFDAPEKGNCASCHTSAIREHGFPVFTDWGFVALGGPARAGAPKDDGLCGPKRTDLAGQPDLCQRFRTPSLRNVAQRDRFFHDGSFRNLTDVVRFYVTRDVTPERWGIIDRTNVNVDPPFGTKKATLNEAEIADLVAFLGTLTDGWKPEARDR
jgi:cytochrome c peroxidase